MAVEFVSDNIATINTPATSLTIPVPACLITGNILILGATTHIATQSFGAQTGFTTLVSRTSSEGTQFYLGWRRVCCEPCNYTVSLSCCETDGNWTGWIGQFSGACVICGPLALTNCQHTCFACNSSNPNTPATPTTCAGDHYALSYWQMSETFGRDITTGTVPAGYVFLNCCSFVVSCGAVTDVFWGIAGRALTGATGDDAGAWCTDGTNDYYHLGGLLIVESISGIFGPIPIISYFLFR